MNALESDFIVTAHAHQEPRAHALNGGPWTTWLMLGGRGAGKTRLGAEWVRALAHGHPPYAEARARSIALVGETEHDVREVMIDGPSGLLRTAPPGERPRYSPSRRRLEWPNGAVAYAFSAEDPEQLRGPQFDAAWCDELAKWKHPDDTFDMLQFGLRHGARPRQLVTTTPRPIALIRRLVEDPRTAVTRAGTQANAAHLSPAFIDMVIGRYAGTRLGRQEIDGEIVEDRTDSLWPRNVIEAARVAQAPPLRRIVVGVDPPASAREGADLCGIVAAGVSEEGVVYVLEDASEGRLQPAQWASRAVAVYARHQADAIVAEANQGGDMVAAVLRQVDRNVPVRLVHATRGKFTRAEPVAALYTQGRAKHVGAPMRDLEDQMADFGVDGLSDGRSPDRLDALVWAVTALIEHRPREPRIRRL
ncbi:MAG: DNA-packaging protein [Pseudolabrys sp.]